MHNGFEGLTVWQSGADLVMSVYEATRTFPDSERFDLISQLRRAGISIISNIAEGRGRRTSAEFVHFLGQARGSLLELQAQLIIAERLDFLSAGTHDQLRPMYDRTGQLINGLMRALNRSPHPNHE